MAIEKHGEIRPGITPPGEKQASQANVAVELPGAATSEQARINYDLDIVKQAADQARHPRR